MLFAEQEIKRNPAEYILFLWQVEDLLRAIQFDLSKLTQILEATPNMDEVMLRRELTRYQMFIADMRADGIMESGHCSKSMELLAELHFLHQNLLTVKRDKRYKELVDAVLPDILAFISKSGQKRMTEIEACFQALYGLMILRLRKEPISPATQEAMDGFSKVLAYLAKTYAQKNA
ncbi:MAG TPA: DUF4924 family protein [Luteibaculaceae bacterium]|nr:DUF4924 family protein [Luteibaculaceae bacterium]